MMATAAAYGRVYDGGQQRVVPLANRLYLFTNITTRLTISE
jgi:hypothetical protein